MSHWAEIDENNVVLRIIVGNNNDLYGDEGYQWIIDNLGGQWIQTSYNTRRGVHYSNNLLDENGNLVPSGQNQFRKNYAGIGYTYDGERDAFIPPKPTEGEWILNEDTCNWIEKIS